MDRHPRIYADPKNIDNTHAFIEDEQIQHIRKALRLKVGDEVIVFDGSITKKLGSLEVISKKNVVIRLLDDLPLNKGYKEIISIQALLKGKKEDEIIKKLTALGVKEMYFVETDRSNIKAKEISANRIERWQKIAIEECKQSERDIIPVIHEATTVDTIPEIVADRKIIASTKIDSLNIRQYLTQNRTGSVAYVIGPEGDFTEKELEFFKKIGFEGVKIHENILRSELANEYIASILSYEEL